MTDHPIVRAVIALRKSKRTFRSGVGLGSAVLVALGQSDPSEVSGLPRPSAGEFVHFLQHFYGGRAFFGADIPSAPIALGTFVSVGTDDHPPRLEIVTGVSDARVETTAVVDRTIVVNDRSLSELRSVLRAVGVL